MNIQCFFDSEEIFGAFSKAIGYNSFEKKKNKSTNNLRESVLDPSWSIWEEDNKYIALPTAFILQFAGSSTYCGEMLGFLSKMLFITMLPN